MNRRPTPIPPFSLVFTLVLAACLLPGAAALGRVKLITLPVRQRVVVHLDHPRATLVEEERTVPLVKGSNQVDFSWANTRIDPHTIVFRVVGPAPGSAPGRAPGRAPGNDGADAETHVQPLEARVLSVSYPPGESSLVWQVSASASGSARVRLSYLLGGLTKSFNYRAVATHDEKTLTLWQYLRVENFAGEQYDDTDIIAGYGKHFARPIGVDQTREVLTRKVTSIPIHKTYTCDPAAFGYLDRAQDKLNVPMHYVIENTRDAKLGDEPLPYGKVRIFQKDSADAANGSTAFLGEDWGSYTPVDDKMRLALGLARDVVVKRTIADRHRTPIAGQLERRRVVLKYEVENFKDEPITLDVSEDIEAVRKELGITTRQPASWTLGDKTDFDSGPDDERTTQNRVVMRADLPARRGDKAKKHVYHLELVFDNQWGSGQPVPLPIQP